jgi:hypothetical protein
MQRSRFRQTGAVDSTGSSAFRMRMWDRDSFRPNGIPIRGPPKPTCEIDGVLPCQAYIMNLFDPSTLFLAGKEQCKRIKSASYKSA